MKRRDARQSALFAGVPSAEGIGLVRVAGHGCGDPHRRLSALHPSSRFEVMPDLPKEGRKPDLAYYTRCGLATISTVMAGLVRSAIRLQEPAERCVKQFHRYMARRYVGLDALKVSISSSIGARPMLDVLLALDGLRRRRRIDFERKPGDECYSALYVPFSRAFGLDASSEIVYHADVKCAAGATCKNIDIELDAWCEPAQHPATARGIVSKFDCVATSCHPKRDGRGRARP